ncbi:MAG: hypothetical protein O7A69_05040 [SAR324 cluster bacterium]|nr:hypothetical protein [SAR324 cluster bacterium]
MNIRAQGDAKRAAAIEAARQTLRDIPQTIGLEKLATAVEMESFEPQWP